MNERPDVSHFMKRQSDGPSVGLMLSMCVGLAVLALLVGVLVGM